MTMATTGHAGAPPASSALRRDLLGLQGLHADDIRAYLATARDLIPSASGKGMHRDALGGAIIANLFLEDSTRTRLSFTLAAKRLGADTIDLTGAGSSASKGETLRDTARNIEAMGVDAIVVRTKASGGAALVAESVGCPVINAGDGRHEHPTQGLLDVLTFAEAKGRLDTFELSGLSLAIVGDIISSRVARSAIAAFTTLGCRVICVGPPTMAPKGLACLGCEVENDFDSVLREVDGVMMLRIQFERHGDATTGPTAPAAAPTGRTGSLREFRAFHALTQARVKLLRPGAIIMHPGPMNRGLELDHAVADSGASVILRQVSRGVAVRMAVFRTLVRPPQ
ncbi:MAG: aspartate carbamoyltransferase catalytic subunit [Phycisphaeraceae bacterium]|nr:aspartate carbamoyltransferase catalytic subunit [Phycisphaeraceae bacterium]MCW5753357.1 aspartate carbamoyltransferase catalytic subunit [Phycisphaeraceae bacterium]